MSYLPEGYKTTKLYEGGIDGDMNGIFSYRVTFGLVDPSATKAMRIRTERQLITDSVYPVPNMKRVTEITPIGIYLGRDLAFTEDNDFSPPTGTEESHILEDLSLEIKQTIHHPTTDHEFSIPQLERLAGVVGLAAFTSLDQIRQAFGFEPL